LKSKSSIARLVRPLVSTVHAYVPGEQPRIKGLIKLNTNENPYPPSPRVIRDVKAAVDGRLRLYPEASALPLREELAKLHGCSPENIVVGNGSDEVLALATRAFVEPAGKTKSSASTIQYFTPSYSLYPVLAAIHGARTNEVSLTSDFDIPELSMLKKSRAWDFGAALTLVTTPNAPGGRGYSTARLEALCRLHKGVVILDEAYVDFAAENAMELALKYPHVIVSRTFSKSYSLCFQRVGYFVGHPDLMAALHKIRDSYNVNGLGQIAAVATLKSLPYYRKNFKLICATRERLTRALTDLGFSIPPSQANFILVRPPKFSPEAWLAKWKEHKILVRWFRSSSVRDYLRITIGTDAEADALIAAARKILG